MNIILALSESHGRWARYELAQQGVEILARDVYTMQGARFEGMRPEAIYIYAPISPGEGAYMIEMFRRTMAWVRHAGHKNPGMKVFKMDTKGNVSEWPEAL